MSTTPEIYSSIPRTEEYIPGLMESSLQAQSTLRPAGDNERRCIIRQAMGLYRALVVGAIYTVPQLDSSVEVVLIPALKYCISKHPFLGAAIRGEDTETPEFVRPAQINMLNHIEVRKPSSRAGTVDAANHLTALNDTLVQSHDRKWENCDTIPPWRLIVLPLPISESRDTSKAFWLLFTYSHGFGDGMSGLAFHRTLLTALRTSPLPYSTSPLFTPPSSPLPPPIETAADLQITWRYLLGPLLGAYLPTFLSHLLNFRASATPEPEGMWGGNVPNVFDPRHFCTALAFAVIEGATLERVLLRCRAQDVKLTGMLHQVVVRALSAATWGTMREQGEEEVFVATTAVNLRPAVAGVSDEDMGVFVTGEYHVFPTRLAGGRRLEEEDYEEFWEQARQTTSSLAARAATLIDQPIGLLRYLRGRMRPWTAGQIGGQREGSYGLSNVMVFDDGAVDKSESSEGWEVGDVVFSQPANAVGPLVNFNVVTRKGGRMVTTVSWQEGVLGANDEAAWAGRLCRNIEVMIRELAAGN